jgi:hypothetical protein
MIKDIVVNLNVGQQSNSASDDYACVNRMLSYSRPDIPSCR